MPNVRIKEGESFDVALRHFKRACERAGILAEAHRRGSYEKPTQVRKRKAAAAIKRLQKKLLKNSQLPSQNKQKLTRNRYYSA